jgi:predicted nucleotidyltransferase
MKSRDEVLTILAHHKTRLMQRWHLGSLALFGSVARNEQTEASDVDLLVEMTQPMGWEFFDLITELETLLGERVDLYQFKVRIAYSFLYVGVRFIASF